MFYVQWELEANPNIAMPYSSYYCRDAAFYAIVRPIISRFSIRTDQSIPTGGVTWMEYMHWLETNHANMRFMCRSGFDNRNEPDSVAQIRSHTIPRAIDKLKNKFPTVEFSQGQHTEPADGFGPDLVSDYIEMRGDTDIVPAFYWSTLMIRYGRDDDEKEWKAVNALLDRAGDSSHRAEWERLRAGDKIPGWFMLGTSSGPLNSRSRYMNVMNSYRRWLESSPRSVAEVSL